MWDQCHLLLDAFQGCSRKWVMISSGGEAPWLVLVANFHGVNIPTVAEFKQSAWVTEQGELLLAHHDYISTSAFYLTGLFSSTEAPVTIRNPLMRLLLPCQNGSSVNRRDVSAWPPPCFPDLLQTVAWYRASIRSIFVRLRNKWGHTFSLAVGVISCDHLLSASGT